MTLSLGVTVAVCIAAIAHASWNAIAHAITDRWAAFALVAAGGAVGGAVLIFVAPPPGPASWPSLGISVLLHLAYNLLLMLSYRLADFGQSYPLARGTAPLLVAIAAAVLLGEHLAGPQIAGVIIVSGGLVAVALLGRGGARLHVPAVAAAVGTGVCIAAYTMVDGVGVRASGSPIGYIAWLMVLQGIAVLGMAVLVRRRKLWPAVRPVWVRGAFGGVLSLIAYGLVLWAQTRGPLAPIAALRETSIVVGAIIGAVLFRERFGHPRIAATVVVLIGIGLLNLSPS
ncbi:DMT family transporter [Microlunatus speluncae]|uniref:DMT family transporter n=1 Tax=Microlunatus speluncae TaxID=2594267 RepID=UPI00126613E8|nr:DMT family transporter [Microlunatus speluncae]